MTHDGASWMPHPAMPSGVELYEGRWRALAAVSISIFIIALDITVVGIAAPSITTGLDATSSQIQWAFDAFTVVLAGFVILGAELAERYGRKGALQIGLLLFGAGSAVCAFAPDPNVLILGRIVSGLGAALAFPAVLSLINVLFPEEERHKAFSIFASISALGLTLGPFAGGLLVSRYWFGSAFLLAVPVAVVAMIAVGALVPPSRKPAGEPLDILGALLSVLSLGGVVFGIIEGPDRGWESPLVLGALTVGVIASATFVWWELRAQAPLLDLRVLLDERVMAGGMAMGIVYFTFNSTQLLMPQYLTYVEDETSFTAGLVMMPFGVALVILSPRSGPAVARFGSRAMMVFSLTMMTAGMATLALLDVWGGVANVLTGLAVYGIGFGLIVAPATAAVMMAVPPEKTGDGSSVNLISRQVGGALGVAILGSLTAGIYRSGLSLEGFHLTPEQAATVKTSLSGVMRIDKELTAGTAQKLDIMADASMVHGLSWAMAVSAAVTLGAATLSWWLLRPRNGAKKPTP